MTMKLFMLRCSDSASSLILAPNSFPNRSDITMATNDIRVVLKWLLLTTVWLGDGVNQLHAQRRIFVASQHCAIAVHLW
jgi:hypothetical protein